MKELMPYESLGSEMISPQQALKFEIQEAKTMWPGCKSLIQQLAETKQNYIIEGAHLLPGSTIKTPVGN